MQSTAPFKVTASPPAIYDPLGDEAGSLVRTCDKISAADKIAWGLLRQRSHSGREQLRISAADVGGHEGRTADAGRARLRNLKEAGLIDVLFVCRKTGMHTLVVLDPLNVLKGQPRAIPGDPQRVLAFESQADSNPADPATSESLAIVSTETTAGDAPSGSAQTPPAGHPDRDAPPASYQGPPRLAAAEEPPEVPRSGPRNLAEEPLTCPPPSGHSGLSVPNLHRPLTFRGPSVPSEESHQPERQRAEEPRRGTSGGTSPDPSAGELVRQLDQRRLEQGLAVGGDVPLAAVLSGSSAFRLPDAAAQANYREQWIEIIRRGVRCPNLKLCVAVKVAAAIVAGEIKPAVIQEALSELAKVRTAGQLRSPASAYFVGAVKRIFARHGLDWTGYASGGRRKPKPR